MLRADVVATAARRWFVSVFSIANRQSSIINLKSSISQFTRSCVELVFGHFDLVIEHFNSSAGPPPGGGSYVPSPADGSYEGLLLFLLLICAQYCQFYIDILKKFLFGGNGRPKVSTAEVTTDPADAVRETAREANGIAHTLNLV